MAHAIEARRSRAKRDDRLVAAVSFLSAGAAIFAKAKPTGTRAIDAMYLVLLGLLLPIAASKSRRLPTLVMAGLAAATARSWALIPGWGSLAIGVTATVRHSRSRPAGAVIGALGLQALLRQHSLLFHGGSVLAGAMTILPLLVSGHRQCRVRSRRKILWVLVFGATFVILALGIFMVALLQARADLLAGSRDAKAAISSARQGDTRAAESMLRSAARDLQQARSWTATPWALPARLVPVAAQNIVAINTATSEGLTVARAGAVTARLGDYRSLKYRSGQISLPAVRRLEAPLSDATDLLGLASARVERVDRSWLMAPLQERLDGLSGELRHATSDARIARDVVHLLPGLLGGQGTRHYFVAFVNTAEERGGGGFLGNYGELTATDGRVRLTRSGPAVALDAGINQGHRTLAGPIEFLTRYGAYDPANSWRDVTYSPHFPYDANVIEQLYPQSGGAKIDGVISIDPIALAALLRFTGPINVSGYGFPLTSANAADVLLRQQYLEFQNNNGTRKNLLDEATKVAFDRLVRGNLPSPQALVKTLGPMVRQRHLMLHFPQPSEQQLVARVGADGAFPPENRGDVFMVAHQNYGNSKIDAYLRRTIRYDALVDPTTGQVTSIAQITLHNEAPATGLPSYVIGNSRGAPAGTSLMNLTIYSRMTASSIDVNGVSQPVSIGREAGLNAYAFRLDIPPRSTARLVVRLRGGLSPQSGSYQLAILPQASVQNDEVHANITEGPAKSTSSAVGSTGDIVRVALQLR